MAEDVVAEDVGAEDLAQEAVWAGLLLPCLRRRRGFLARDGVDEQAGVGRLKRGIRDGLHPALGGEVLGQQEPVQAGPAAHAGVTEDGVQTGYAHAGWLAAAAGRPVYGDGAVDELVRGAVDLRQVAQVELDADQVYARHRVFGVV